MELLKLKKRKSRLSDFAYTALNLALAVGALISIISTGTPWIAFILVLISKWRVFAVRPRFWKANILANLVDLFVSLSVVIFIYAAAPNISLQIIFTVFYIIWLLFIKPRSKRGFVFAQSCIALFMSISALMMISYEWNAAIQVAIMWLIGYSVARHVLTNFDEPLYSIFAGMFGLLIAELGWISHHWGFAYALPGFGSVMLSQAAIIALLLFVICYQMYVRVNVSSEKRSSDWIFPIIFSVLTIMILILFFNTPQGGQGGL